MMFVAQKLEKRNLYLSHPSDTAFTQTDCLLLKIAREGDASSRKKKKKKSPSASIFYCLLVPVIKRAKHGIQKTAFIVRLFTWHSKRAKMYVDKTSKSTTCGRKGDFVKMCECIRMQEMVWWRGGMLGELNLHMEIRVSVDKILHKVHHCSLWTGNGFLCRYGVE